MASVGYWAEPEIVREQRTMFSPTLDDMIDENHEVRLLDETLRAMDWSEWEAAYERHRGQPPIHPRVLAGLWLYGMMRKIRTSRMLEYACRHNVDFIWLIEGLTPDHSTLAEFFTKHNAALKSLFRQVCKVAMSIGLVRLGNVAFDATRVKSANSRFNTLTGAGIEKRLAELDSLIEQMMAEVTAAEAAAGDTGGTTLPDAISNMKQRREKLKEALVAVGLKDEARRKQGTDAKKNPAQLPMNDRESSVMPNKEGGYAPNYTPTCLTDGTRGFILDTNVLGCVNETHELLPAVDRATEMQPVAEEHWPKLPLSNKSQLDKSCFVYDAGTDQYFCPMGRVLPRKDSETREGVLLIGYESRDCSGCRLAQKCLQKHENPQGTSPDHTR